MRRIYETEDALEASNHIDKRTAGIM